MSAPVHIPDWELLARTLAAALRECETDITAIAKSSRERLERRLQAINTIVQTTQLAVTP